MKNIENGKERFVIKKLQQCYKALGDNSIVEFLKTSSKSKVFDKESEIMLLEIENYWLLKDNKIENALKNLKEILTNYDSDEAVEKKTLYRLGLVNLAHSGNREEAEKYFNLLAQKYPNDMLTTDAIDLLNNYSVSNTLYNYEKSEQNIEENETAKLEDVSEYRLSENYPNPFNPITNIAYALPEKSQVIIKVYDVLGREVAELVNDMKQAGTYTVTFNGSSLASGMYIVNMQAGDPRERGKYVHAKKILLLK
jgi:tetratricopeptide (TPR) repeat protein